jgi:hypothetical protein
MSEVEATIPGSITMSDESASTIETVEATRSPPYPVWSSWKLGTRST